MRMRGLCLTRLFSVKPLNIVVHVLHALAVQVLDCAILYDGESMLMLKLMLMLCRSHCRMCLFLQSQDFQRHTEHIINSIHASAQHAEQQLKHINDNLQQSTSTIADMGSSLSSIATTQEQQQHMAEKTAEGIQQLHENTQTVQSDLDKVLHNEAS